MHEPPRFLVSEALRLQPEVAEYRPLFRLQVAGHDRILSEARASARATFCKALPDGRASDTLTPRATFL